MDICKLTLCSLATLALTFGGVAQAESIRAGASLPVAKSAKVARKTAKKGVELNQDGAAAGAGNDVIAPLAAVAGVGGGVAIGVLVSRQSP